MELKTGNDKGIMGWRGLWGSKLNKCERIYLLVYNILREIIWKAGSHPAFISWNPHKGRIIYSNQHIDIK